MPPGAQSGSSAPASATRPAGPFSRYCSSRGSTAHAKRLSIHCIICGVSPKLCREVRADLIEAIAWSAIWQLLKDPALLLQMGRAYYEAMETPEGNSTDGLQRELERLAAKTTTTRDMMQENLIAYAKGKADIRACEERIRQIEQELPLTDEWCHCRRYAPSKPRCMRSPLGRNRKHTSAAARFWKASST